jgi:hypothetical protein
MQPVSKAMTAVPTPAPQRTGDTAGRESVSCAMNSLKIKIGERAPPTDEQSIARMIAETDPATQWVAGTPSATRTRTLPAHFRPRGRTVVQ